MKKIANKSLCWGLACAMVLAWLLIPVPLQAEAVSETPTGSPDDYYLVGYINGADYGCQEDYQNLGSYKFVDGKLTATFTQDSYVFVKNGDNSKWLLADSYCTDTTCTFSEGKSEKMFVPGGVELTFTLVENGDGSLTLSYTVPGKACQHPTHNDDGICTDCGAAAVEHTFESGVCTICSLEDMPVLVSDYYASGSFKLEGEGTGGHRGDIVGIAAKNLSEAVYVAGVYSDGTTTWTFGVLGYSIGAYCSSQASKGGAIAGLAQATAVYGYHAKQYFG